ncbi:MAG TPA: excinuclease ABC subunit UvrC [Smithellaceae bacterium]|nr:excinuclease ABC subunit UvrC [Smithellaceae bacterium]HOH57404.1 excinuclease ABC subunit UvrC [Smithellaceae bacterium]HPY08299.1 excinuclease ABC subunit UvrC [Smithellaceae bacterium]HQC11148.1 excinuclease ABC subunit UvrC [Smithellaceae bacterium]
MDENTALKEKMTSAPRCPGVYIMQDASGKVIYVGKANDLKNRISSYLTGRDTRPMAPFLMARASDIAFITTATEKEALILENNLIKKHRPRYNVILRDDKTYYHLSLDPAETFPRLRLVRKRQNDAALYFGPYPSGLAAKETLRFIQRIFPLRTCRDRDFQLRARPCLEYQIGRCLAPCKNRIDEAAYRTLVENAVSFLRGRRRELISDLKKQMEQAAQELNFEEAARLRNRIGALSHALEQQHVDGGSETDKDVLGVFSDSETHRICILFVRAGKLTGSKSFTPVKTKADREEILSSALRQHYDEAGLPEEILLPYSLPDEAVLLEWLAEKQQKRVRITVPRRGAKKALVDLACANARELQASDRRKEEQKEAALLFLQEKLMLAALPRRIECFDISNLGGKSAVGSMVVFQDGEPDKSGYRRFRVCGPDEPDDYGMMREVLTRRFQGPDPAPDLLVVDGGKGQLNVALAVLSDLKIKLDVIGLAKEERSFLAAKRRLQGKPAKSEDRVYLPRRKDAIYLSSSPAALALLQRLRDEAHRFAVSYHRKVKTKNDLSSVLDAIPDIGPSRRTLLLKYFGSAQQVRKASLEDLQKVPGIGRELAEKIYSALS